MSPENTKTIPVSDRFRTHPFRNLGAAALQVLNTRLVRFILIRLATGAVTVLGVLTLTFILVRLAPGDPAARILDVHGTPEAIENLRRQMGLDRPIHEQYLSYVGGILSGDFGVSLRSRRSVLSIILSVLPPTVMLGIAGNIVGLCLGVVLGVVAAFRKGTSYDYVASVLAVLGISIPLFWLGIVFLLVFSLRLGFFPATGTGEGIASSIGHLALPSLVLGVALAGMVARIVRSSMVEELSKAYVVTVLSIGGSNFRVIRHALKNTLVSLIAVFGIQLGRVLGGIVVLEVVFARPGLGKLIVDAILARDYPVALGGIVFFTAMVVVVMVAADILYGVVDPRIREGS